MRRLNKNLDTRLKTEVAAYKATISEFCRKELLPVTRKKRAASGLQRKEALAVVREVNDARACLESKVSAAVKEEPVEHPFNLQTDDEEQRGQMASHFTCENAYLVTCRCLGLAYDKSKLAMTSLPDGTGWAIERKSQLTAPAV